MVQSGDIQVNKSIFFQHPSSATMFLKVLLTVCYCVCAASTVAEAALTVYCGKRGEAEQGRGHTIGCEGLTAGSDVTWRFMPSTETIAVNLGTCTAAGVCTSRLSNPRLFEMSRDGGRSEVRVQRVERDGKTVVGEWWCQQSGKSEACTVSKVVWPPEVNRNQCTIRFDEYHHEVNAECHIVKSFPEPSCKWLYNRVGYFPQDVPSSYTKKSRREYSDTSREVFYDALCSIDKMTLPKEEGIYEFRVVLSPGDVVPSVVFNGTNVVAKPNTPRLKDCVTSYVNLPTTPPETRICACETFSMGSPPGLLQWIHPEGYVIASEKSPVIEFQLKNVEKSYSNRTFACVVQHHTGPVSVTYTPKLAYGPKSVVIIDDSEAGNEYHTFKCIVGDVNPKPEITWAGEMELQQRGNTESDGSFYVSTIVFKVKEDTPVTCTASNPELPNSEISDAKATNGGAASHGTGNINWVYIVIGVVAGVVLIAGVLTIAFVCRRKRSSEESVYQHSSAVSVKTDSPIVDRAWNLELHRFAFLLKLHNDLSDSD